MQNALSVWDDVRRLAGEIELKIHLAGMDAADRWHALEARIGTLEKRIEQSGERAEQALVHELHEVRDALHSLRDEVVTQARRDFVHGW